MLLIIKLELQVFKVFKGFFHRAESFKYSFFPVCVMESNNFGNSMRGAKSIKQFKSTLMKFFKQKKRLLFSIHDQIRVKLLRRLQLKLSPMCNCAVVLKSKKLNTSVLRCQFFLSERQNLHDGFSLTDPSIITFGEESLLNALLYGSDSLFENKFLRFNIP